MGDCGVIEFLRGGMIADTHITASAITDSRVASSVLQSCDLQTLASIDEASAKVIVDALAKLPPSALADLGKVLMENSQAKIGGAPATTVEDSLPSTVIGTRDELLGKPAVWLEFEEFVIPGYKAE